MYKDHLQQKIDTFWEWFQVNHTVFLDDDVPAEFIEALNNHILDFGLFSWQIGEGQEKPRFLTISPNGNPQRLEISKEIIESAPHFGQWEFNYCKPAKDWDYTFEMYDSFMVLQQMDASDWDFALFEKSSGKIEIRLHVIHPSLIDFADKKAAVELVVTNILGEEKIIEQVENLTLVNGFIPEHKRLVHKIPQLKKRFDSLV